jgi:hypothetical protein
MEKKGGQVKLSFWKAGCFLGSRLRPKLAALRFVGIPHEAEANSGRAVRRIPTKKATNRDRAGPNYDNSPRRLPDFIFIASSWQRNPHGDVLIGTLRYFDSQKAAGEAIDPAAHMWLRP